MIGGFTGISLGILIVFHLVTIIGQLFKVNPLTLLKLHIRLIHQVSPPYDPTINLVGAGTPGKGETPIEKLSTGIAGCWCHLFNSRLESSLLLILPIIRYLSSIAAVLLMLMFGNAESQRASLICPVLYHVTIALC